jgi:5-methylcytosine-specific restriction endonuclease McrA
LAEAASSSISTRASGFSDRVSPSVAQQRFSDIHRRALWEAHRKRCLYCGRPLLFKELVIDHVIPEKIAKDANQVDTLRITHGLSAGFDIAGDENLAPACHACNLDKIDRLLSPERAALIFTQIEGRLPKVNHLKARYQKQAIYDDVTLGVSIALEKGLISPAEAGNILRRYEAGDPQVNLSIASIRWRRFGGGTAEVGGGPAVGRASGTA